MSELTVELVKKRLEQYRTMHEAGLKAQIEKTIEIGFHNPASAETIEWGTRNHQAIKIMDMLLNSLFKPPREGEQ